MLITLRRHWFTEESTIGLFEVDKTKFCFSLEDTVRADGVKIPGKTAIPAGEYVVTIDNSQRFLQPMPHILNVPFFEGVRIHSGNSAVDTEGCILLGYQKGANTVWESKKAFNDFFALLGEAVKRQEIICLDIRNEPL